MARLRRLRASLRKDLLGAIRTGSFWVFVALPIFGGLLARMESAPTATVAYTGSGTGLVEEIRSGVEGTLEIEVIEAADGAEARELVRSRDADVAVVLPEGLGSAMAAGERPRVEVIHREFRELRDLRGELVASLVEPSLRRLAGQQAPAEVVGEVVVLPGGAGAGVFRALGARAAAIGFLVLFSVLLILLILPADIAEESEKKTLDALLLAGTYGEVILAKAIYGLLFIGVLTPVMFVVGRLRPADPLLVVAGIGLLSVGLVALGILIGIVAKTPSQVAVWGQVAAWPLIAAALATSFPLPAWADGLLTALPSSQATRLTLNGVTGQELFGDPWLSVLVVAAWGVLFYVLLFWRLARREA